MTFQNPELMLNMTLGSAKESKQQTTTKAVLPSTASINISDNSDDEPRICSRRCPMPENDRHTKSRPNREFCANGAKNSRCNPSCITNMGTTANDNVSIAPKHEKRYMTTMMTSVLRVTTGVRSHQAWNHSTTGFCCDSIFGGARLGE